MNYTVIKIVKKYISICSCLLVILFSFAGCSNLPPTVLKDYATSYYYYGRVPNSTASSDFYVQVSCSFKVPEDMYLYSIDLWVYGVKATGLLGVGVGFNNNYEPFSPRSGEYMADHLTNYYGICINGVPSDKLESNYIKKDSFVEVVFPIMGGLGFIKLYDIFYDEWAVTMTSNKPDGSMLSNLDFLEEKNIKRELYYLGSVPVKKIMVGDLVLTSE